MSQPNVNRIKIANPSLEDEVRTYRTSDVAAAETTHPVISTTGFVISGANDYYILSGDYGQEKTEILLVDASDPATDSDSFKTGACKYSHSTSEPITLMRYNQIRIYGGTTSGFTPSLGTPIATIDIDPTQQFTEYVYEGSTYSYFVTTYYNSNDDEESGYSEEIYSGSFTRRSAKRIIESGLIKAMTQIDESPSGKLNWDNCLEILQDGIDEILARKRTWPFLRKRDSTTFTTTANQQYITKPTDLGYLEFIIINNQELQYMNRVDYNAYTASGVTATTGSPLYYTAKNDQYFLIPTPDQEYTIIYEYYKVPATITDLSTEVDLAFVPVLIYYCASQFSYIRGNDRRGDKMYKMFEKLLEQQVIEYSGPEQTGQAEEIDRTSAYGKDYLPDSYRTSL